MALLLATGIFVTCTLPTETKHALHTQGSLHPWIHILTFAVLAWLLIGSLRSNTLRVLAVVALLFLGYLTEARESRWNHWPIEVNDLRTDAAGVLLGTVLGIYVSLGQAPLGRNLSGSEEA